MTNNNIKEPDNSLISKLELSTLKIITHRLDKIEAERRQMINAVEEVTGSVRLFKEALTIIKEERNEIHRRLTDLEAVKKSEI